MKKILAVLALSLFASMASAQATNTYWPPLPGSTMTGPLLLSDGSAAAPSIAFANEPGLGFTRPTANVIAFNAATGTYIAFTNGIRLRSSGSYQWSSTTDPVGGTPDVFLYRDAANTLALRNGGTSGATVPQTFNVYNFCDGAACATGYERAEIKWSANNFIITTTKAGTGSDRTLSFYGAGGTYTNTLRPLDGTDSDDLGLSTTYWKNLFLARSIQGSKSKTLTDGAAAATFVRIAVPTNGFAGGEVIYTATSTDGTDILVSTNTCRFSAADTGGTVTAGTPQCGTPATAYRRANTLICTISGAVSTTNYDLQATCTDDKAAAQTVTLNYRLDMPQPNTVTPQ